MATLQSSLSGLNQGKRYQRPSWPADRFISLKNPGEIETLRDLDLKFTWTPSGGSPTDVDFVLAFWSTPEDLRAEDYSEEVTP